MGTLPKLSGVYSAAAEFWLEKTGVVTAEKSRIQLLAP